MKNLIYTFIAIMLTSVNILAQTNIDSTKYIDPSPLEFGIYDNTPLIRLIANPEKYDGKMIQVVGYLNLEFEGNALYLHEDDFKHSIYENSFWVDFSDKLMDGKNIMDYNNKYVYIIGTFNMKSKGHLDLFGGTINNIVRLNIKNQRGF